MSIFKSSFENYIQNQLNRREKSLNPLSRNFIPYTTEKQCIIRMGSGVDIDPDFLKETSTEKGGGASLARDWMLEGGVPIISKPTHKTKINPDTQEPYTKEELKNVKDSGMFGGYDGAPIIDEATGFHETFINDDGVEEVKFSPDVRFDDDLFKEVFMIDTTNSTLRPRTGFYAGNSYKGDAYGSIATRSNPGDGFGMVPMPGIIDASVRTTSAYGSLRTGKVTFVCHNRKQLEILELLYMRPGFPILLEWQWVPYINNKGRRKTSFPVLEEFFKYDSTIEQIHQRIKQRKSETSGNYDAIMGFVKNFEINARVDGGYDCTTEIISMGEVLQSLKGTRSGHSIKNSEGNDVEVDDFQYYIKSLIEWSNTFSMQMGELEDPKEKEKTDASVEVDEDDEEADDTTGENTNAAIIQAEHRFLDKGYLLEGLAKLAKGLSKTTILYKWDKGSEGRIVQGIKVATDNALEKYKNQKIAENKQRYAARTETQGTGWDWFDRQMTSVNYFLGETVFGTNDDVIETQVENYKNSGTNIQTQWEGGERAGDRSTGTYTKNKGALLQEIIANTEEFAKLDKEVKRIEGILDPFIIRKGEPWTINTELTGHEGGDMQEEKKEKFPTKSGGNYVRWDFLAWMMNEYMLPSYKSSGDNIIGYTVVDDDGRNYLDYNTYNEDSLGKIPRFLATFTAPNVPADATGDVVVATEELQNDGTTILVQAPVGCSRGEDCTEPLSMNFNLSEILEASYDPNICILPHQLSTFMETTSKSEWAIGTRISKTTTQLNNVNDNIDAGGVMKTTDNSIGYIYLNLEHLLERYEGMRYSNNGSLNPKFSITKFMKKLWEEDVNGACAGSHNFIIQTENNDRGFHRIVDMGTDYRVPQPYTFDINSPSSVVRDFSYKTNISKEHSSTISIAAQAPDSISDLEALTVFAFNKNIKNRFTDGNSTEKAKGNRIKNEKELILKANKLKYYLDEMLMGTFNSMAKSQNDITEHVEKINPLTVSTSINYAKRIGDLVNILTSQYKIDSKMGDAGKPKDSLYLERSAIIPITFTCKMDGVGGIVIGNVFKINKNKLPLGYQGDDIAFVILKESQKITSGQDWTTQIEGQLMLQNTGMAELTERGPLTRKNGKVIVDLDQIQKEYAEWFVNALNFPDNFAMGAGGVMVPSADWHNDPKIEWNKRATTPYGKGETQSTHIGGAGGVVPTDSSVEGWDRTVNNSLVDGRTGDIAYMNNQLMLDISTAMSNLGTLRCMVSYARNGHTLTTSTYTTRHASFNAVDLSAWGIDGGGVRGYSDLEDAKAKGLYEPIMKFVANMEELGYAHNVGERGNPKAILSFAYPNHHHHIHVSNTG